MGTKMIVRHLSCCDICGRINATYDFKTKQGPWANGCKRCYLIHRLYDTLGTGKGQLLVLEPYYGIQAWGLYMGSNQPYIDDQSRIARKYDAPKDAIYYNDPKQHWVTTEGIMDPDLKLHIETSMATLEQEAEKPGWNE